MDRNPKYPSRKRIRLPRDAYQGPGLLAMITLGTNTGAPVFTSRQFTEACIAELRRTCSDHDAAVLVYCFMPDHVHLVVRLDGPNNLIDLIRLFKGRTSRLGQDHQIPLRFWQPSFYDHLIREDDDLDHYIRYVIENPVVAGIASTVNEYPYTGSFEYEYDDLTDLLT
jgi:putative transposase